MTWSSYTSAITTVFNSLLTYTTQLITSLFTNKVFITVLFVTLLWVLFDFVSDLIELIRKRVRKNEEIN